MVPISSRAASRAMTAACASDWRHSVYRASICGTDLRFLAGAVEEALEEALLRGFFAFLRAFSVVSFLEGLCWNFSRRFWRSSAEELALRRFRFFLSVEELVLLRWCFFFLFFVLAFFSLELSPEPEEEALVEDPAAASSSVSAPKALRPCFFPPQWNMSW